MIGNRSGTRHLNLITPEDDRPARGVRAVDGDNAWLAAFSAGEEISFPVAHHDGNYQIDAEGLARLKGEGRVALTYRGDLNGSVDRIAGVMSENRRVLGMMPHPERAAEPIHGGSDGARFFHGLIDAGVAV